MLIHSETVSFTIGGITKSFICQLTSQDGVDVPDGWVEDAMQFMREHIEEDFAHLKDGITISDGITEKEAERYRKDPALVFGEMAERS